MAGLLFVMGAGLFLLGDLTPLDLDGRWVAPLVLIVIGGVGLLSTLRSQRAELDEL